MLIQLTCCCRYQEKFHNVVQSDSKPCKVRCLRLNVTRVRQIDWLLIELLVMKCWEYWRLQFSVVWLDRRLVSPLSCKIIREGVRVSFLVPWPPMQSQALQFHSTSAGRWFVSSAHKFAQSLSIFRGLVYWSLKRFIFTTDSLYSWRQIESGLHVQKLDLIERNITMIAKTYNLCKKL